jgi:glycosyltransferase involved in cell wall biosynthesis
MRVIFSSPDWTISGVNSFNHNLMRSLQAAGHDVELLLNRVQPVQRGELPPPADIKVTTLPKGIGKGFWVRRWQAMAAYLNAAAPCIYVPGYDFLHSAAVPCLGDGVGVIGVVHSDDPYHYEHLVRLGRYWNATIAVSSFLLERVCTLEPLVAATAVRISYGLPCPPTVPARPMGDGRLKILYSGRFEEAQKRVSDLPRIAEALAARGIAADWTLVGAGSEEASLKAAFGRLPPPGRVTFTGALKPEAVVSLCRSHDCFILTSNFEGLPVSMLEAMAQGAIPVVTDIESGVPDLVTNGVNGFRIPIGDVAGFADCLAALAADPAGCARLSAAAFRSITEGGYAIEDVTRRYIEVFERVLADIDAGRYRRPKIHRPGSLVGDVLPPPSLLPAPDAVFNARALIRREGLLGAGARVALRLRRRLRGIN